MQKRMILGSLTIFLVIITILSNIYNSSKSKIVNEKASGSFNWNDNWEKTEKPVENQIKIPKEMKPVETKPEPVPTEQITANSYEEALELAKKWDKSILLMFTNKSCKYCVKMKNEVLSRKNVKDAMMNYIFLVSNTDRSNLASKYGVKSIPYFLIIDKNENILRSNVGYMNHHNFVNWLSN